jgi:hypothetical protein
MRTQDLLGAMMCGCVGVQSQRLVAQVNKQTNSIPIAVHEQGSDALSKALRKLQCVVRAVFIARRSSAANCKMNDSQPQAHPVLQVFASQHGLQIAHAAWN